MTQHDRALRRVARTFVQSQAAADDVVQIARALPWRLACQRRLASGGFGRVAGCRQSPWPRCRGGICRSRSGRRSRSCAPWAWGARDRAPARPLAVDDLAGAAPQRRDARRRSRVPRDDRAVACGSARPASEAGEACARMRSCGGTCRIGSPASCSGRTGSRSGSGGAGGSVGVMAAGRIGAGRGRGARSRSLNRLRLDFPDDESMRISPRGDLPVALCAGPRRAAPRADRVPAHRAGAARAPGAHPRPRQDASSTDEIMISERPAEAADRAVPGHWEGDLILGLGSSAIGTLVERTTPVHDAAAPAADGRARRAARQERARARRAWRRGGPRRDRATRSRTLPEQLRRSLTWDQGAEMAQHAQLRIDTGLDGLLLRPAEPLAARHQREHQRAAAPVLPEGHRPHQAQRRRPRCRRRALNSRPRKTLGWRTPAEVLDEYLSTTA